MELKIRLCRENAVLPKRGSEESAGLDLSACLNEAVTIAPGKIEKIPTGLAMELPKGTGGFVFARSGLGSRGISLANGVGVIDSDYRGELSVVLINHSGADFTVAPGDRIAQLVVMPVCFPEIVLTEDLSDTKRGAGGFGSTGLKGEKE